MMNLACLQPTNTRISWSGKIGHLSLLPDMATPNPTSRFMMNRRTCLQLV